MKIAFLSRYTGTVNRGVETHVAELAKLLSKNYSVDVLSGKDADSLGKVLSGKYDLVIPTNGRWQALKMSIGRLFGGYKTLIAGHAGIGRDDWWNIFITAPNFFVALTEAELKWAKKWSWFSKVVKIPNGINLDIFNSQGRKLDMGLKTPVVLSVGALEWYKYHERTIDAVAHLDNTSLLIIGAGSLKAELESLGKEKLQDRFKLIQCSYEKIADYYRSCHVFTLPSWDREAFGIVYLEAMASGLPVVAPDDDSRREIVGQAGILVNTKDSGKFAQAIESALQKKWGSEPRKQAEKFSWDKVAAEYVQLIDSIKK